MYIVKIKTDDGITVTVFNAKFEAKNYFNDKIKALLEVKHLAMRRKQIEDMIKSFVNGNEIDCLATGVTDYPCIISLDHFNLGEEFKL